MAARFAASQPIFPARSKTRPTRTRATRLRPPHRAGEPMDAASCLAAVDAVERLAWVDRERIGVTGGSYGGYMTTWLVGHTNRFRAAVSQRGLYNWTSFYGTSDIGPWFGEYVLGGPVYERPGLYAQRSPLTYAKSMRTPLLLIPSEQH